MQTLANGSINGRMTQWQKHLLGLVLPLAVSATTFAFAPEYDAPQWMINVSAGGIIIAIGYAVFLYSRLASRGGDYFIAPAVMFVTGAAGVLVGLTQHSPVLAALGGLVPFSGIVLATGYLWRRRGKNESAK